MRDGQRGSAKLPLFASGADTGASMPVDAGIGFAGATLSAEPVGALGSAAISSTWHRLWRGEGALLAINLSLIATSAAALAQHAAEAVVSLLAIALMYAFNDAWDAPADRHNPRKDRKLVATYLANRGVALSGIVALKVATALLAFATLGARAGAATAGVLVVNLVYSMILKGVPVVDVAWCGLWGALYAGIVTQSAPLAALVGIMTAICHLYQTLNDRQSDAANGIVTTAVRSRQLSAAVIAVLTVALFLSLRAPLGAWSWTAVTPLILFFAVTRPGNAWLLTKVYFGVVWLFVLGGAHALG